MMRAIRAAVILVILISSVVLGQTTSGYHVAKKVLIGQEGGWDYLFADGPSHRLYVSHGDHVVVLNSDSLTIVGEIPKTDGVHGIAIAQDLGRGFISNGRTSTVTIFDLNTLKVIKEVPVTGKNPDAILYDPFSKKLFTFNGRSQDATVLNPVTGDTTATIWLGGKPEFAVTDLKGHVYVNIEDKSEVAAIDAQTNKVLTRWSIAPGEEPSGLAIDMANRRLFSVCGNKLMMVSDPDNAKVVTSVSIGNGPDACQFDPGTKLAFSSNGEGTLTVVRQKSANDYEVVDNVKTQRGARTMTLDLTTHDVYVVTAEFGETPKPTPEHPRPRPAIVTNTFCIIQLQK